MVQVVLENTLEFCEYSFEEIEKIFQFSWQKTLCFTSKEIGEHVKKQTQKAFRKEQFTIEQKWLGTHFKKELLEGYDPPVSIRFINKEIGYGVFAEKEIAKGAFIGEYTGFVRKRVKKQDLTNAYCFEYAIGGWRRNPYIIDAQKGGNLTRFINHSDQPNLEPLSVYTELATHIILLATKPIAIGEQLAYDYGEDFWKKRAKIKKNLINF